MIARAKYLVTGLVFAGVVTLAALGSARNRTADTSELPAHLDDTTFWRMVTELSEPGGWFRSDNFVSNEGELQYVIPQLERTIPAGRAYVGVGPEQNFTYIAALNPGIAFIVDIRRQNLVLHLMYKALMELSEDRVQFVSALLSRPAPEGVSGESSVTELFEAFDRTPTDTVQFWTTLDAVRTHLETTRGFPIDQRDRESLFYVFASFAEGGTDLSYSFGAMGGNPNRQWGRSWMPTLTQMMIETDGEGRHRSYLADETSYRAVRELQLRNLIVPVVGNFGGDHALKAVAAWLAAHRAQLGAFYASNVEQYLYMQGDAPEKFFASLATFPQDSASTFVRSVSNRGWLPMRNPNSRLAQQAIPLGGMLEQVRVGRARTYWELVTGVAGTTP
jgi:hypothetical protein